MADDTDQFAKVAQYMVAVFNDENKARRLMEILEAERKLNDARLALDAQTELNMQQAKAAEQHHADAAALHAEAEARHADADYRERVLAGINDDINAEKQRWSEQKDLVERQQDERDHALAEREKAVQERERMVSNREQAVAGREDSAQVMADQATKLINRVKAFTADIG